MAFSASSDCVPARKFVPIGTAGESLGAYMRFHPSGRYLLSSRGGGKLFDLESNPVRRIETPTIDEVYPVEGSWKLLASPNHNGGREMKYFSLQKILDATPGSHMNVREEFSDSEHNQYYHSSAEFADSTPDNMHFRTVLYTRLRYRDYRVSWSSSGQALVEKGEIQNLCERILEPETRVEFTAAEIQQMEARVAVLEAERLKIAEEILVVEKAARGHDRLQKHFSARSLELSNQIRRREAEIVDLMKKMNRLSASYGRLSQPIVSKDGHHVAAQIEGAGTTVLKIDGRNCHVVGKSEFYSGKVSFAYPNSEGDLLLAMFSEREMRVFDVKKNLIWKVSSEEDGRNASLRYPGFLKDGRLAYYTCERSGNANSCGVVFVDPYQVAGAPEHACITESSVAANARAFQSTK